jgi:hypothetical protein
MTTNWGPLDNGDYTNFSVRVKGIINIEGAVLDSNYFDAGDPPVLIFYGTADDMYFAASANVDFTSKVLMIPITNGISIHQRLTNLGIANSQLHTYSGGVHGSSLQVNRESTILTIATWLYARIQ